MKSSLHSDVLTYMPWYWSALIAIAVISLIVVGGLYLVRKLTNQQTLRLGQEAASYSLNTIALLYCVIVGFVVIRVQERHNFVKDNVEREANLLVNLYYNSCDVFNHDICLKIQKNVKSYAENVLRDEWPLMVQGTDIALAFPEGIHNLWEIYDKFDPRNNGQMARYQESLHRLNELTEARFARLNNVGCSEGAFMWTVLIYGGILVILCSYLFVPTSFGEHLLQLVFTTSFIVLVLLFVYSLDCPYVGPSAIQSKPFEQVLELIESR